MKITNTKQEFLDGFDYVVRDFKDGITVEQSVDLASTPANNRSHAFTAGARVAADAIMGWLDEPYRVGKHFGITRDDADKLVEIARAA